MKKIILRKKVLTLGYVGSAFIDLQKDNTYSSTTKLIQDFGWEKVMLSLFNENLDASSLKDSSLFKSYKMMLKSDKLENDEFIKAYQFNDSYAVFLDANIYLFHLFPKGEIFTDIVPWYYADAKKFIGDTWWESDEEILQNLKHMPIVDFLDRYKGYM